MHRDSGRISKDVGVAYPDVFGATKVRSTAVKKERHVGPLRWRGKLNMKDIVERIIAGVIAGVAAGSTFFVLDWLVGG